MKLSTMQEHISEPGVWVPGHQFEVNWPWGTDLMQELLNGIAFVASQKPPFKIETDGYKIYWAGTVLRIDISDNELM